MCRYMMVQSISLTLVPEQLLLCSSQWEGRMLDYVWDVLADPLTKVESPCGVVLRVLD